MIRIPNSQARAQRAQSYEGVIVGFLRDAVAIPAEAWLAASMPREGRGGAIAR